VILGALLLAGLPEVLRHGWPADRTHRWPPGT
jgi:hypothetical protein